MSKDNRPNNLVSGPGAGVQRRTVTAALVGAGLMAASLPARAQFPQRPIRLVVPLAVGGSTDITARTVIGPALASILGQPIVVENVTGASGQIAYETVARAAPDGHTLLLATSSAPALKVTSKSFALDIVNDFTPISTVEARPVWIVVPKDLPYNTIQEFVAYAKANPGKLNYGSGGTLDILATAWMNRLAGIETTIVRYRGGAPAMVAVAANEVHYTWNFPNVVKPLMDAGKVRLFAMSGKKRSPAFPDVPAVAEVYPEYSWSSGTLLLGPKGLPDPVVDRLYRALKETLERPEVRRQLEQIGTEATLSPSPAEFRRTLAAEVDRWREVGVAAKFTPE